MNDEEKNEMQDAPEMEQDTSSDIDALQQKSDEHLAGWKRALADYDNLKKQLAEERQQIRRSVKVDFCEQLLPVVDHFDQALRFKPENLSSETENWLMGILHVRKELEQLFDGFGLTAYASAGDTFDPHLHDAVQEKTEEGKADQEILEVIERGWKMDERIIRPAKVIVNKSE